MRKIVLLFFLFIINAKGQDCPVRIGVFQINYTTLDDLRYNFPSYKISNMSVIDNNESFQLYKVHQENLDDDYSSDYLFYEIKPDISNIKSWYNTEIASPNDSTKVIFIPNYEIDDIIIKNLLLKFYNEKLYYMSASLNKKYTEIILEKYKGKGHKTEEKISQNTCKNVKFKKYKNTFTQYFFTSEENNIKAILTFDFKINKYCEMQLNDRIEIFDFDTYVEEGKKIIPNLEKMKNVEDERLKREKEEKLRKF